MEESTEMEIPTESDNITKKEDDFTVLLPIDEQTDKLTSNPVSADDKIQDDILGDVNLGKVNVEAVFDSFCDSNGQIYRKYSLREVKPVTKPFQHKIKTKNRNIKRVNDPLPEEQHICDVCCRIFKTQSSLKNHIQQHAREGNVYTCSQCDNTFSSNRELCNHKIDLHDNKDCFSCQKCQLAFSDHYIYLLHILRHMGKPYKCPECQVSMCEYKSIAAHMKIHFNTVIKCTICSKEIRQNNLQQHLETHKEVIKCVECGKVCKDKSSYKYHLISHTGVKPYQCLYCGKGFANASQVKIHTTLHTDVRCYRCDLCDRRFRQQTDLSRHRESHNEGKYECDYCRKKFKQKPSLKYHIRSHIDYRPYKCPTCKSPFTTLSNLRSHVQAFHVTEKQFVCHLCKTGFRLHCHYLRHLKCKRHLQNAFSSKKEKE